MQGKVALVTGGSRGLGREMVLGLAREGADVVIASRKVESCEDLAELVRKETGQRALAVGAHMGRWEDVERLADAAYDEFGHVDVLVNNAGMAPLYPSLAELSEELYDKVFAVNLKGPFRLSVLVGERMAAGEGGSIINMSSFASTRPSANDLPYAAAKAGLNALTLGFAGVLGPKVRVNGILVGPFLTDIAAGWDVEGFATWAHDRYALGRLGQPPEIVGTILYLAGDASSFTTGAVIPVDGGVGVSSPFPADLR